MLDLTPRARALLDTLLPSDGELPGLFEAGFDEWYAHWVRTAPPLMVVGFHAALGVGIWVAPLLAGKLPPITRHDRDTREAILEALGKSRSGLLRQVALLLKVTTTFGYGVNTEVRRAVGYPVQFDDPDGGGQRVTPELVPELRGGT